MTANDNSDGDSIEVPNDGERIGLGSVTAQTYLTGNVYLEELADRTYSVIANPKENVEDERFAVTIREDTRFEGGSINRQHSLSPGQARQLAALLTAAADKLGHVPEGDGFQPAEL